MLKSVSLDAQSSPVPENEIDRLYALHSYHLLDTPPEEEFDELTRLAAKICDAPVALVTLVDKDRQWIKSCYNADVEEVDDITETPRDLAFCAHTIMQPDSPMVVEDALKDSRFADNPLVTQSPGIRFYAGVPLTDEDGYPLGSLCLLDTKPGSISPEQLKSLESLAHQTVRLFKLRRLLIEQHELNRLLQADNMSLAEFADVVSQQIRKPLRSLRLLADSFQKDYADSLTEAGRQTVDMIHEVSVHASVLMSGIVRYIKAIDLRHFAREPVDVSKVLGTVLRPENYPQYVQITADIDDREVSLARRPLRLIVEELIQNAVVANGKAPLFIEVKGEKSGDHYEVTVRDNGAGISEDQLDAIFELFYTVRCKGRFKELKDRGGVGLPIARKLAEAMGARLEARSIPGHQTEFKLRIPLVTA